MSHARMKIKRKNREHLCSRFFLFIFSLIGRKPTSRWSKAESRWHDGVEGKNGAFMFANLIIQFFVKMNNQNILKVLNLHSRFGALFLWEKRDVLWANIVRFYWIIESAKKWIMECVNEHSVFSKSDFGENWNPSETA